ncbi:MAG: polysaccharide biosynthesis protein PelA [Solirubrobacterales bacterium]|jgi:uncharacterized protein (TIGR01370 family)|nr:polysaccharide biosynthesis protein PelA [Solirubrobacterales bacterium]
MIALAVTAAAALVVAGATAVGGARAVPPRSFAFAIGNGNLSGGPQQVADRLGDFDLVVVDGELARADKIAALRARGVTVLGYLSVGTIEKWRSWYPRLKRFRLGAWADWKDEWFADVSKAKLRRLITGEIAPELLAKGFDGLFLDNVDMVETRNHAAQRDGMRDLVQALAGLAHSDGRLLFAQNGAGILDRLGLLDSIDGWNREDVTWTYDFDRHRYVHQRPGETHAALAELAEMAGRGLITTSADYTRAGDADAEAEAVANACSVGATPYVGDIGLTAKRLPDPPLTCP